MSDVHPLVGSKLKISVRFTEEGVAATPAGTVKIYVKKPDGATDVYTYGGIGPLDSQIVLDGTGLFHVDYTVALSGTYLVRGEAGAGEGQAAEESSFIIRRSRVL